MSGLDNKGSWINKNQQILNDKLDLQQRKTARLEERKLTVEVETMEKDAALKDMQRELEIEKTRQELELLKNVRAFEITVDSPNVSYENVAQTQMDFDENQGEG